MPGRCARWKDVPQRADPRQPADVSAAPAFLLHCISAMAALLVGGNPLLDVVYFPVDEDRLCLGVEPVVVLSGESRSFL